MSLKDFNTGAYTPFEMASHVFKVLVRPDYIVPRVSSRKVVNMRDYCAGSFVGGMAFTAMAAANPGALAITSSLITLYEIIKSRKDPEVEFQELMTREMNQAYMEDLEERMRPKTPRDFYVDVDGVRRVSFGRWNEYQERKAKTEGLKPIDTPQD